MLACFGFGIYVLLVGRGIGCGALPSFTFLSRLFFFCFSLPDYTFHREGGSVKIGRLTGWCMGLMADQLLNDRKLGPVGALLG